MGILESSRALKADKRKALCQWCDRTIDVSLYGQERAEIALKKVEAQSKQLN